MALSACSGCEAGNEDTGTGGSGASAANGPGTTGQGGGFGQGGGGTCENLTCSADLHDVVCDGQVVKTCADDQGCAAGACIPACDAAKANKSSVGCDYYTVNPDVTFSQGACFAAFVANTWTTPASLVVERDGQMLDASSFARIPNGSGASITYDPLPGGQIPPGQVAVLFLAQFNPGGLYTPACPAGITTAVSAQDAALHGTGIASSFRITSSVPVVAYDIFPYGGGPSAITSATLLLPTSAWDTNYIAVEPYKQTSPGTPDFYEYVQIVAAEDDTQVTISPTAAIVGGPGVPATGAGVPATYTINRGQVLQFTQETDLTGSPVQSTKPIGLLGGNRCMVIPDSGVFACDAGHQMIPPVRALGTEYAAVHHRNRFPNVEESPPWRIVGAVDGTTLSYDPAPPAGAPTTIGSGQIVEFSTSAPFVVKSQDKDHPFYVSGHMTGCSQVSVDQFGDCRGDPETVNAIPSEQFLDQYVFFTDPTYPETSLTVIRKSGPSGFQDVKLACMSGPITGWQPIGSGGTYQYAYVDLVTGNFQPQNGCDNGRHEASSAAPFTITVWGWGSGATGGDPSVLQFPYSQYVSYAYPAGASVQPLSEVVVPPVPQ
ncbi:MAG: IgGFc-binding protein [Myxococcales bacterium]|nr:IgGFc-binding protein [Myxococcales bacterium]